MGGVILGGRNIGDRGEREGEDRRTFILCELSSLGENQASRKPGVFVPCSFPFSVINTISLVFLIFICDS